MPRSRSSRKTSRRSPFSGVARSVGSLSRRFRFKLGGRRSHGGGDLKISGGSLVPYTPTDLSVYGAGSAPVAGSSSAVLASAGNAGQQVAVEGGGNMVQYKGGKKRRGSRRTRKMAW